MAVVCPMGRSDLRCGGMVLEGLGVAHVWCGMFVASSPRSAAATSDNALRSGDDIVLKVLFKSRALQLPCRVEALGDNLFSKAVQHSLDFRVGTPGSSYVARDRNQKHRFCGICLANLIQDKLSERHAVLYVSLVPCG
mmetsp:Transcript_115379/g.373143  ORF Transcript_115379/g.373143 Transcript_115379/m.373143 type:complete len:138 (-) Transcript_115379:48-461(-)